MKIVFMGTPDFSVKSLEICQNEHELVGVFTQPDRPKGRGKKLAEPPVKVKAKEYGTPIYQPEKLKTEENVKILKELNPDCIVVVAYGQILSKEILDIPKYGCINVHASLLPRYRGASPINWAIVMGEKVTGVTTMYMDKGLDTGDMIYKIKRDIPEKMNAGELHDLLMDDGAKVLSKTLKDIEKNIIVREKQRDEESNYAPLLNKKLAKINWELSGFEINNLIRGLFPWPIAFTEYKGDNIKIFLGNSIEGSYDGEAGEILNVSKDGILVKTGDGAFLIKEIQVPGSRRMKVSQYILGHNIEKNIILK